MRKLKFHFYLFITQQKYNLNQNMNKKKMNIANHHNLRISYIYLSTIMDMS